MWQGLKPGFFLGTFCGTTEVVPCYKARFDGVERQPRHSAVMKVQMRLRWQGIPLRSGWTRWRRNLLLNVRLCR